MRMMMIKKIFTHLCCSPAVTSLLPLGSGVSLPLRAVWTAFPVHSPGSAHRTDRDCPEGHSSWETKPHCSSCQMQTSTCTKHPLLSPLVLYLRNKNWGNVPWRVTATIITEDKIVSSGSFPWDVFNSIYFGYFQESLTSLNPTIFFIIVRNNTIIQKGLSYIHLCEKLGHLSD